MAFFYLKASIPDDDDDYDDDDDDDTEKASRLCASSS